MFCLSASPDKQKFNSLRLCGLFMYLFLRVLRVLRGQTVCHHEEHEGHEVWITVRAKNARVTKIVLRSLRSLWLNFLSVPSWRSRRRRSGHALRLCASHLFPDSVIQNSTTNFKYFCLVLRRWIGRGGLLRLPSGLRRRCYKDNGLLAF